MRNCGFILGIGTEVFVSVNGSTVYSTAGAQAISSIVNQKHLELDLCIVRAKRVTLFLKMENKFRNEQSEQCWLNLKLIN